MPSSPIAAFTACNPLKKYGPSNFLICVSLSLGVSKEQARTILPLNLNTTFIWTGSLYAFLRLCQLRLKPDAQQETREVVQEMLNCIKTIPENPFKHTLEAFNF